VALTTKAPEVIQVPPVDAVQLPNGVGVGVEVPKKVPLQSVIVTGIVETIVEVTEAGTVMVGCNTSLQTLDMPGIPVNPRKHGFTEQGSAARTLAAEERSRRVGNDFIFNKLREDRVNCGKYEFV
jgi:hypothetical protein